jgi:exopolyphosphatase/guanosine-5'-triphosphate,3'-diphosphate pyrophosphatase
MELKSSRIAVIDIGTNTCLLLIAELDNGRLNVVYEAQEAPRMGEGVSASGVISKASMQRVLKVLKSYVKLSNKNTVDRIFAFGTSALRDAQNKGDVVEYFKNKAEVDVQILSGAAEAKFGYYGALFDMEEGPDYAVLDIGGGSTEISYFSKGQFFNKSFDIGSVRMKEKFFKNGFDAKNLKDAKEFAESSFKQIKFTDLLDKKLVGVAGTLTTLSALKHGLTEFDEKKIHKDTLTVDDVEKLFMGLAKMSVPEIQSIGGIMKGRADIITPGALILLDFMKYFGFDEVTVSSKGLRYGVFLYIVKS